jgi:hypothetical protein
MSPEFLRCLADMDLDLTFSCYAECEEDDD